MQLLSWQLLLLALLGACALMLGLWLRQRRTGNAGIVDVGWSACLGGMALLYGALGAGSTPRRLLVAGLGGLWALRLATYLWKRVVGKEEDARYVELKRKWGPDAQRNLFLFFQAQALIAAVFSLPFLVVAQDARPWDGWCAVAILVWLVAVVGEAVADAQLAAFKRDPANRGKTCRAGLWRYSRHPNYFFEWIHWWAYVALGLGAAQGWVTLLGPALMLWLLFKVTGIPYTEAQALARRGDDYREYQRTTSAFVPWPPKAGAA